MKIAVRYLCILPLLFFLTYGCKESILETSDKYPKTIPALSKAELYQLQETFNKNNDYKLGAKLNKYGFIGSDTIIAPPNAPQLKLTGNEVVRIAIKALLKNNKFTNINSESELLSSNITIRDLHNSTHWIVLLEPQSINFHEVLNSQVAVYVYGDNVYCIFNSWYPDAFMPFNDKINSSEAKGKMIGREIDLHGFYPYGSKYTITESSIGGIEKKVIVPYERENSLELRVAWKIPVKFHELTAWYVYLDSTTGEILKTEQRVVFN